MKSLLTVVFILTLFSAYSQDSAKSVVRVIDSLVDNITKQKSAVLTECDSITDINGNKDYKCWNYYFKDTGKSEISKVSISFNGLPEELCFYYDRNKVIKAQENRIKNGKANLKWSIYIKHDNEIYTKGKLDTIRGNEVERAYYFSNLAFHYANQIARR